MVIPAKRFPVCGLGTRHGEGGSLLDCTCCSVVFMAGIGTESGGGNADVSQNDFYVNAALYWEGIPATVDGMLGGFSRLSGTDIGQSKKFLLPFMQGPQAIITPNRALDCGAGIGRVSRGLLLPLFSQVDLVEQNAAFLDQAKSHLGESLERVGRYIASGLQDFSPEEGRYDLIWCQWVLSHLTDEDLISFLRRCAKGLSPGRGLIVVKENIADEGEVFDEEDSSVTRCMATFHRVFEAAGLTVVKQENQANFPKSIFQVTMFALR